jgi:hypothetical protein
MPAAHCCAPLEVEIGLHPGLPEVAYQKIPIREYFLEVLGMENMYWYTYFMAIWNMFRPFGIFYGHLVYFTAIGYIYGHLVYFTDIW